MPCALGGEEQGWRRNKKRRKTLFRILRMPGLKSRKQLLIVHLGRSGQQRVLAPTLGFEASDGDVDVVHDQACRVDHR